MQPPHQYMDSIKPLIEQILNSITAETPAELVQVYEYNSDLERADLLVSYQVRASDDAQQARLREIILRCIRERQVNRLLHADELAGTGFDSGIVFLMIVRDETVGALAVFPTSPQIFSTEHVARLMNWVNMAGAVLENRALSKSHAIATTIQRTAQILGQNPSPQDLVNALRDHLLEPHVSLCVMLLYGPLHENRPNGPFEHLEVRGTWSRRSGSAIGLGVRFFLDQYPDLLEELETRKMLSFNSFSEIAGRVDPLVNAFMRGERVRSLVMLALGAAGRRLGVLLVATDTRHEFGGSELRGYRAVSEFLAVSTMGHVLQQQHDFVLRARAALLDAVTDGVLMVLPSGTAATHSNVLTVNETFTQMFNLTTEQSQELTLEELIERLQIAEDTRLELAQYWLSVPVRDPATQTGEFHMIHPQGYPASIEWYSAPVYQDRRVIGRIFTFHDNSAQRTAASLRANFVSRVSHELRTPLTSIKGFAQFILEESDEPLPPKAREYTEIILNSARHLNAIFSDIIEITRADTGELKLTIEPQDVRDLIRNAASLMELQYKARQQTLVFDLDDDLPQVYVDASRFMQVLTNLLSNANKYAPSNSNVQISARHLRSQRQLPGSAPNDVVIPSVLITVSDEGNGLSLDEAEQVFLPFYRSREAKGGKIEGTGLGLTICRSLIELHRGKIWAEARKRGRKGAHFLFTLPTVTA
jgi:signal transduction histidine kinase